MNRLVCVAPDALRGGRNCGGKIERTKLYYCDNCHGTESARRKADNCVKCGNKYIRARGYICKNCRTVYDIVETK